MNYPKPIFDDDREAREAAERQRAERKERKRQENRAKFPTVTAFFDEMEAQFPGCRVIWAVENGNVVGNPPPEVLEEHQREIDAKRQAERKD